MFHDLNVCVSASSRGNALRTLHKLGYDVVALTTVISNQKKVELRQLPQPGKYDSFKDATNLVAFLDQSKRQRGLTVLERLTIEISDVSQLSIFNTPELNKFDLVAVRPANEKLLQQCMQFDFDIISLHLENRIGFQLKRPNIHVAQEKGMLFEISYSPGLRDTNMRRNLISSASMVVAATGGKHLLMSSGALTPMELRAPLDVVNLGMLFEIPQLQARQSLVENAACIVKHGDVRARVHKGIVRIEKLSDKGSSFEETESKGERTTEIK